MCVCTFYEGGSRGCDHCQQGTYTISLWSSWIQILFSAFSERIHIHFCHGLHVWKELFHDRMDEQYYSLSTLLSPVSWTMMTLNSERKGNDTWSFRGTSPRRKPKGKFNVMRDWCNVQELYHIREERFFGHWKIRRRGGKGVKWAHQSWSPRHNDALKSGVNAADREPLCTLLSLVRKK